ncbi:DAK2 domain-containing protein [Crassaminicella indica]|uniref:DAK2 domain-containing protein n=1 Tax=Crassaminicella indica TaxID=2855394 RepID=A0ABX8REH6_9CLOT|nr:DAK2 domain-containing protein [Crassaminicella indica]QXM07467.1 DAK2 domain-containing protein [Crassaminicella indica]
MFIQGANVLQTNKHLVDELNVFPVPDGDTGTNMSLTMNSAAKEAKNVSTNTIDSIVEAIANGSLMGARGNSGVILSQIFRGFAKACKGKEVLSIADLAYAFKSASDTAYKAVMKPIEGTILTIIRKIGEKSIELSKKEIYIDDFLYSLIEYGEQVLNKTPEMLKTLKEAGVVDAGGKGLIFIFNGFYEAITGKEVSIEEPVMLEFEKEATKASEDITFGYCTEFIIKGSNIDIEEFKGKIGTYGDCMLVVGDESLVKVHIHTNHPGVILEKGLALGQLTSIKIDNMRQQHQNKVFENDSEVQHEEIKDLGMIAVTMGEGLTNIFKDLNVDEIITGGQTMNPSTEDIKKAIDRINAKHILIFPNNSNIILAANQAKELSDKNITVIPTKTVPQGIAAILAYNQEVSLEENIENMIDALKNVKTGQVTYSVRDTQFNDISIKKGDILGIVDGKITVVGSNVEEEAYKLLKDMITEDDEILTIFYGDDRTQEQAQALAERIEEIYEDIDVEVYYGGQPLYYYIFSLE